MSVVSPAARANPGCNPNDLINALGNVLGSIGSPVCLSACSDGVGCGVAVGIAATLTGIAADSSQGEVTNVCNAIQNALKTVRKGQDDTNYLTQLLQQAGVSAGAIQQITSVLGSVTSVLGVASCACSMEQGVNSLGADIGACIQDALCSLDDLIGNPCTCTAPPPVQDNCSLPLNACGYFDKNMACQGEGTILRGPSGYTPVSVITEPGGTFVSTGGDSSDGHGHCSPVQFCFCPKPMVPTWIMDRARDSSGQFSIFTCQCPAHTHSAGVVGGIPMCLCDGTNLAMQPPGSLLGMCPPPSCPTGHVMIGNKCVADCANPSQVLLASGQCCNPAQVTSCGECCPAGQAPDPKTGSCVRSLTPVETPPPTVRP